MPYFKKKKERLKYEGKTVGFSTEEMKREKLDNRNVWGTLKLTLFFERKKMTYFPSISTEGNKKRL